jgi:hypothetical protein
MTASPPLRTSQETLARSNIEKALAFAQHPAEVFQPHPSEIEQPERIVIFQLPGTPYQLEPPINRLKRA